MSSEVVSTTQAAKILNLHVNTVRRWADAGILKGFRMGPRGDRRFYRADLEAFQRSKEFGQTA